MSDTTEITLADLPLRNELRDKNPYGAPQLNVAIRLNTNENPYSPSPALVAELKRRIAAHAPELNRYPERDCVELRVALAKYISRQTGVTVTKDNL